MLPEASSNGDGVLCAGCGDWARQNVANDAMASGFTYPIRRAVIYRTSLAFDAHEICRVIRGSRSRILRRLRIRTKGTRAIYFSVRAVGRGNMIRHLAVLYPLLERADHIKRVDSVAAAAVIHPSHHKEAIRIHGLFHSAQALRHTRVV